MLSDAVRRQQPMSDERGRKVFDRLEVAVTETVLAKSFDPETVMALMDTAAFMYRMAAAKTKKQRIHFQWLAWQAVSVVAKEM